MLHELLRADPQENAAASAVESTEPKTHCRVADDTSGSAHASAALGLCPASAPTRVSHSSAQRRGLRGGFGARLWQQFITPC